MRIVFIGAVQFSEQALRHVVEIGGEVVGVCTLERSSVNADHADLSTVAAEASVPVRHTPDVNSEETIRWIEGLSPDVIFCFGWSRLLQQSLLQVAPLGVVGYHPAALPANRGRHPLIWALVLGLRETASTFFFMDDGADTGDILSQESLVIMEEDNAASLYARMTRTALDQITAFLPELANGTYRRIRQDHRLANTWRKRGREDGRIDWRMSAESIHNLIRALTKPYIGAHFDYSGQEVKVWMSEMVDCTQANLEPGKVLRSDDAGLLVKAGHGAVLLRDLQPHFEIMPGEYL